jgi:hypothetical protein
MHTKQEQELQMFIQHMHQCSEQVSAAEILKAVMDGRLPSQVTSVSNPSQTQQPRTVPLQVISSTPIDSIPVAGTSSACVEAPHSFNMSLPDAPDGSSISVGNLAVPSDPLGFAGPRVSKFRPVSPGTSLRRTHSLKDQNREQVRDDLLAEMSPAITLRRKQSADAAAILNGMGGDRLASTSEPDEPINDAAISYASQSTADSVEVGMRQPAPATADQVMEQFSEVASLEQCHLDAGGLSLPLVSQYQVLRGGDPTQQVQQPHAVMQQNPLAPVAVQNLQNLHHLQSVQEAIGNLAAALSAGPVSMPLPTNIIGSVSLPAQMNSFAATGPAPGQSAVAQGISQASVSQPHVMSQSVATTVPQTILQPTHGVQPANLPAAQLNQSVLQTQAPQPVVSLAHTVSQSQLSVSQLPSAVPQTTQALPQQSQPAAQLSQPSQQTQLPQTMMQVAQPVPQTQLPKAMPQAVPQMSQAVPQTQLLSAVTQLPQTAPQISQTMVQPVPPVTQSMLPQPAQQLPIQAVPQANVPQVAQAVRPAQLPQGIPQGVPQLTQAVVQPQLAPGAPTSNLPPVLQSSIMQAALQQPTHMLSQAVPGVPPLTSAMPQLVGGLSSLMQPTPQQFAAQLAALSLPPYAVGNPLLFGGIPGLYPGGGVTAQHATPVLTLQQQQFLASLPLQQQQMMLQQILMQQNSAQLLLQQQQQQQHLLASQQQALGPQFHMLPGAQALPTPLPSVGVAPHIPSVPPPSAGAAQTQPSVQPVTVTSQASGMLSAASEVDRTKPTVVDKR